MASKALFHKLTHTELRERLLLKQKSHTKVAHWPALVRVPSLKQSQGFSLAGPGSPSPRSHAQEGEGMIPERKSEML